VARDAHGRVLPGATPNPGGRPKAWREFQEAVRERTPEALKIIDQALKSKDPEMRRWACERVLGYAWGRPPQRVQIGGDEDAPPVQVGRVIDWGRLPPERLGQLLEILDSMETAGAGAE
jgi:hypothetical protein